jgi:hypothetical protein
MIRLKHLLIEGRYDAVVTALSRELLQILKAKGKRGRIDFDFPVSKKISIGGISDFEYSPEMSLKYKIEYDKTFQMGFDIYGQADDEQIDLVMTINPTMLPGLYSEIVPLIKDAIRHEIEHVAQNILDRPDSERFEKVPHGDFFRYLTAKHEIPAFVRGLYKGAKTRKIPMSAMIDKFLKDYSDRLTAQESEKVKEIWTDYAKRNLPKAQFV